MNKLRSIATKAKFSGKMMSGLTQPVEMIVLDANIIIRAGLGRRVRQPLMWRRLIPSLSPWFC
jgi:hypothetical protein